jgi:hypothetical protein
MIKKIMISILFMCVLSISFGMVLADMSESQILTLSLVNQDPDPAIAGNLVEFRVGVENLGGESVENVVIEFVEQYPFSKLAGEEYKISIGTLNSRQGDQNMKIAKFRVKVDKDTFAGDYELKIKTYEEDSAVQITRILTASVENQEGVEIIYIDQVELIPGKITPMTFTINNVGSTPLRDLTFQWENEDDIILPVGSDNTKYIKYIDVGDSSELMFNVIASANADPDLYKLDLTLSYEDSLTGEEQEISTKAGIYVGGATDFDAAYSGSSSGEYSFAISNIGSVSASSVTVRFPNQQGWKISGSNSVIIGNLNEGDYTIASFQLQKTVQGVQTGDVGTRQKGDWNNPGTRDASKTPLVDKSNGGITDKTNEDSQIKLEIIYTDSRGNRNTIQKEVYVDSSVVNSAGMTPEMEAKFNKMKGSQDPWAQAWGLGKWVLLGIVILFFFGKIRTNYKKGKIEKSSFTYFQAIIRTIFFWKKK